MDITNCNIVIKRHVFEQAMKRGIHPDLIENTIYKGKTKRFGKHGIKFISKGTKRTIICVGELEGNQLKIITIEEGN